MTIIPLKYEVLDTSYWLKVIDYNVSAEKGILLAFGRATLGKHYIDPYYKANHIGANETGMPFAPYFVTFPEFNAAAHIELIKEAVGNRDIDGYPVVDMEIHKNKHTNVYFSKRQITDVNLGVLEWCKDQWGGCFLYTRANWMDGYTYPDEDFLQYPLIVAQYNEHIVEPDMPTLYEEHGVPYTIWQRSADGNGLAKEYGAAGKPISAVSIDLSYINPERREWLLRLIEIGNGGSPVTDIEQTIEDAIKVKEAGVEDVVSIIVHEGVQVPGYVPTPPGNVDPPPGLPPGEPPTVPSVEMIVSADKGFTNAFYIGGYNKNNKPILTKLFRKEGKIIKVWNNKGVKVSEALHDVDSDANLHKDKARLWMDAPSVYYDYIPDGAPDQLYLDSGHLV